MLRARRVFLTQVCLTLVVAAGCMAEGQGPGHRQQPLALSDRRELEIGREAYAEMLSGARVLKEGPLVERVERVSGKVAR
ncbi:MAG TPA: hypothetical protein VGJ16_05955, partial [Pirellulales bacterium]